MRRFTQLLSLLRFQVVANPYVGFAVIGFGMPILLDMGLFGSFTPTLDSALAVQNLFMVALVGMWILAPDMMGQGYRGMSVSGTEFLLTRALDRPVLYRARGLYLYVLVLVLPTTALFYSLKSPDLTVTEYNSAARQQCLHSVPGSASAPQTGGKEKTKLFLPRGRILLEEMHLWLFTISALAVQLLLIVLVPLRHRMKIFYTLFFVIIFLPWGLDLTHLGRNRPSAMESLFFLFTSHQLAFWLLTAAAFILGQLWCEQRFLRQEH